MSKLQVRENEHFTVTGSVYIDGFLTVGIEHGFKLKAGRPVTVLKARAIVGSFANPGHTTVR